MFSDTILKLFEILMILYLVIKLTFLISIIILSTYEIFDINIDVYEMKFTIIIIFISIFITLNSFYYTHAIRVKNNNWSQHELRKLKHSKCDESLTNSSLDNSFDEIIINDTNTNDTFSSSSKKGKKMSKGKSKKKY